MSSGTVTTTGETGTPDDCPAADPAAEGSAALVLAPDWPEGGTLDASCDAVAVEEGPLALLLVCSHPDTAAAVEVRLRFPELLDGRLDELVGATDLRASFFNPPRGSITCFQCYDLSVRSAGGDLLVLSHATDLFASVVSEGESVDMTGASWLDARSDAYQNWSLPFSSVRLVNLGCDSRPAIRPGSEVETPLAIELAAGEGVVAVYDRNVLEGVAAGRETFDIWVSDAFSRGPLNCGDCPLTHANLLVLAVPLSY